MKKIFLFLALIIALQYSMYGQYGEECSRNNFDFYIYTPKTGDAVKALRTSNFHNFPSLWESHVIVSKNYAEYVIDSIPYRIKDYNCHGYAWYMSEGVMLNTEFAWIDNIVNDYPNVGKYWADGSYEVYDYKNKPHLANLKVYYGECGNWDHTAVTTDDPDIFISKMGPGYLVAHRKDHSPYYSENLTYYKKVSVISGADVICSGKSSTYTLNNPPSGN